MSYHGQMRQMIMDEIDGINNLAYKTVSVKEQQLISNWYRQVHRSQGQIQLQHIMCCNSFQQFFTSLILTIQSNGSILFFNGISQQCIPPIKHFGLNYSEAGQEGLKDCSMIVIQNPNRKNGKIMSEVQIERIVRGCQEQGNNIPILFDEREGDHTPSFTSAHKYQPIYDKIIIVNQVGFKKGFRNVLTPQTYALVHEEKLRGKIEKFFYQGFKIITSELHLIFFRVFYSQAGLKYCKEKKGVIDSRL